MKANGGPAEFTEWRPVGVAVNDRNELVVVPPPVAVHVCAEALGWGMRAALDGRPAFTCLPPLLAAMQEIREHPKFYAALNPPTGIRADRVALRFMEQLFESCLRHVRATVRF